MFEKDEGIRSKNQIQGIDTEGNLKNVRVDESGALVVSGTGAVNSSSKTLMCDVVEVGTEATVIAVNKTVSKIEIGNYSETEKVTINVCDKIFKLGASTEIEVVINAMVDNLTLSATGSAEVQYLVEGKE